eukprot:TRINITY_DN11132_c0_g1_i1.p2 TRINITY_DN11132_c0_g1~~TRINITY_DN11132_c0_g1_i1.p2  ORF type:complete len:118 (-),score=16.71 TRINITY_DN11132_c0_g1_i1:291-644(-)
MLLGPSERSQASEDGVGLRRRSKASPETDNLSSDRSFSPSPQRSHWTPRPDGRYRKRDSDEPRTDLLGMDGCALYCVFWIIINGFIGTMLFFTIHARDRDFFKPVTQDPTGFFFGRQ